MSKTMMVRNRVQLWNPVTKKWIKVDTTTGRIMAYRAASVPYKNIRIVGVKTRREPSGHVQQVQPAITIPARTSCDVTTQEGK